MRLCNLCVLLLALTPACAFHSVASHWNGRVGPDGQPVFVRSVTNVGFNVFVFLPLLGNTTVDEMIDECTAAIAEQDSDYVRVIETSSENYWHGFPPFTWIFTPVITNVGVEYRPSEAEQQALRDEEVARKERARKRRDQDHSDLIPEPREPNRT